LKQIFWRNKSWVESKACIDRQLLLLPNRGEFSVQLGAVHEMQGNTSLAKLTYLAVLQDSQDENLRGVAGKRLLALEPKPTQLH
jgi:hypothetical protein